MKYAIAIVSSDENNEDTDIKSKWKVRVVFLQTIRELSGKPVTALFLVDSFALWIKAKYRNVTNRVRVA